MIDLLKAAFVQGRLHRDEFDARIGQALVSRTYGELAAVTAGIPAELTGALPRRPPRRARRRIPFNTAVTGAACMAGLLTAGMIPALNAATALSRPGRRCDEVRQNLSAIQNREFGARSPVSQGAIVGRAEPARSLTLQSGHHTRSRSLAAVTRARSAIGGSGTWTRRGGGRA